MITTFEDFLFEKKGKRRRKRKDRKMGYPFRPALVSIPGDGGTCAPGDPGIPGAASTGDGGSGE